MKYRIALVLMLLASLVPVIGCENPANNNPTPMPRLRGVWDLRLVPQALPDEEFYVTVETGGGSGLATVSVSGPGYLEGETVIAGSTLPVGNCGVTILFGATTGFSLAAGDFWTITVTGGEIGPALPGETVDSVTGLVRSGGDYTCVTPFCDGSALAAAVPDPGRSLIGAPRPGGQWYSVNLAQNYARVTASMPEEQAMTVYLGTAILPHFPFILPPLVSIGDAVTVTYRRTIQADGAGGDFLRVIAVNGSHLIDAEYWTGDTVSAGDTTVSLSFTATSPELQLDFIAGLSQPGERVLLDAIQVSTQAGPIFAEGFEGGPDTDCGVSGANRDRFEPRLPNWRMGSLCVSTLAAPVGAYALRFEGGSYRQFTGSILSGSEVSGIASLLGGLFGSANISQLNGLFAEAWEPVWTRYFTSFSAAQQSPGNLVGNFKGESYSHDCIEQGQVTASIHQSQLTDLSSFDWVIRIAGQVVDCDPPLVPGDTTTFGDALVGNTLTFGDTLGSATGDTVEVIQLGGFVLGRENAIDDWANEYRLRGALGGNLLTVSLTESNNLAIANGIGAIGENVIVGVLTGRLVFDSGRVCTLEPGSVFRVTLIPK